jgi:hypothetical protein
MASVPAKNRPDDRRPQGPRVLRDLDAYPCKSACLYSEPIPAPEIAKTHVLFKVPGNH